MDLASAIILGSALPVGMFFSIMVISKCAKYIYKNMCTNKTT